MKLKELIAKIPAIVLLPFLGWAAEALFEFLAPAFVKAGQAIREGRMDLVAKLPAEYQPLVPSFNALATNAIEDWLNDWAADPDSGQYEQIIIAAARKYLIPA